MLGKPVSHFTPACNGASTFPLSAARASKLFLYFCPFKEKMRFPFELLPDPSESVCKQFAVIKPMYGKKVRGIERSTVVVDPQAVLVREWRGVNVPGHAQEVLNFVKAL